MSALGWPRYRAEARSETVELMDAEPAPFEEFAACLRDIARINAATNAHAPTISWLGRLVRDRPAGAAPLRVLDVGCGYGDTLRAIARWAARRDVAIDLVGIDINPWAKRAADAATPPDLAVRFETADLFAYETAGCDVIISSLFTHHLDDDGVLAFLRWMHGRARLGWYVNDLHRHAVPYAFIALAARALRLHRFVRNDAPLSVARSFRRREWDRLIARSRAGGTLGDDAGRVPRVAWEPLFRYCVAWERDRPR